MRWSAASIITLCAIAAAAACTLPQALSAEIVTQDRAAGVPCRVGVWQGDIGPLDGRGTPLLTANVRSGTVFQVDLTPALARAEAALLWVSFECEGYHLRVRAFESGPFDTLLRPEIELGRVWVPKKQTSRGATAPRSDSTVSDQKTLIPLHGASPLAGEARFGDS